MIFQNNKFYHEQIMAVNLFIHTSVSHFWDLLVKKQEETRRDFIRRTRASYTTGQISRKDYICKMCYKFLPVL